MPAERYFIEQTLAKNSVVQLKENEFHHLSRVMRTRKGDIVELVNGKGELAVAKVEELRKDLALLFIDNVYAEKSKPPALILAQAFPKPERLSFILEKGTELGVDAFWLFPGQLSQNKQFFPNQQERAQALLIAAMKQCGRLFLPSIEIKPFLDKWNLPHGQLLFGDLDSQAPWLNQICTPAKTPVIFFTGPESGWSEGEVELLRKMGSQGVRLNTNILRTDTAAIAAASIIQMMLGE